MRNHGCVRVLTLVLFLGCLAGCGGNGSSFTSGSADSQSATIFTVATDAPLPAVISCQVTVNNITLFNGTTTVTVLASPATVDFARLNGLHELLDLTSVPPGTYTSATLTLAPTVTIKVLDTTNTPATPPTILTTAGTVSQMTVTVPLGSSFSLADSDVAGLAMELDLRKALLTDASDQITGVVNPAFRMRLLPAAHADVSIDELRGGVVSVTNNNTFVIQDPRGKRWTVTTDTNTDFETPEQSVSVLNTNMVVQVSGQLNRVTHAIQATELAVLSTDKFLASGLLTSVRPATGPATAIDLFVRHELPDVTSLPVGQIGTLALNGSETYRVANIRFPFTSLAFNNSALVAGQEVAIGGQAGTTTVTPKRIVLQPQGQVGRWIPGSPVTVGTFQLDVRLSSISSLLLPSPLSIVTTGETRFINLSGLSDLSGIQAIPLRVLGFILLNASHQPVMVARAVERLAP